MSSAGVYERSTTSTAAVAAGRLVDYVQLAKPRIAVMAMTAVTVGYLVGMRGSVNGLQLVAAELGILGVAAACNFLNQWYEIDTDRLMCRTAHRPLVAGRLSSIEVVATGVLLGVSGIGVLAVCVSTASALLSALTLVLYVAVYTPLKRVTSLCTVVGAVAGALPPVLGWVAAGGELDQGAWALFGLLFAWQFPHFLAIATIHRADYEAARLKMLPMSPNGRSRAAAVSLIYAVILIPISLLVWQANIAGVFYASVAVLGGVVYLISVLRFAADQSVSRAREVLLCSIVYLPTLLLTMTWEHFQLLS